MSATKDYVDRLTRLKTGELGLLRTHAGQRLDESIPGFDLFTGLWWPLRAPHREVAWLIAKLYSFCPIPHSPGDSLARQLHRCRPNDNDKDARKRYRNKFDQMLLMPLDKIEPALQWGLRQVASLSNPKIDWVKLTDNLSAWEREETRLTWAKQFMDTQTKGHDHAD